VGTESVVVWTHSDDSVAGVEITVDGVDPNVARLVSLTMGSRLDSGGMAAVLYLLGTYGDIQITEISGYWMSREASTIKILSSKDFPEAGPTATGGACQTFPPGQAQGTWCPW
jgi:hypothetical protein